MPITWNPCKKANIVLLITVSANPCIMINTTESVVRPTPVPCLLFSHLLLLLPRAVWLLTRNNQNTHNEILYKYIHIFIFPWTILYGTQALGAKIQLLRTVEKFRSLPNENWFNSQQIFFVHKMKQKLHFLVSSYTKCNLATIKI